MYENDYEYILLKWEIAGIGRFGNNDCPDARGFIEQCVDAELDQSQVCDGFGDGTLYDPDRFIGTEFFQSGENPGERGLRRHPYRQTNKYDRPCLWLLL